MTSDQSYSIENRIRNYFHFSNVSLNSFRLIKTSMQSLHVPSEHSKTEVNFHSKNSSNILKMCWKFDYFQLIWLAPAATLNIRNTVYSQLKNWWKYQLMIFHFPNGTKPFSPHSMIANNNWIFFPFSKIEIMIQFSQLDKHFMSFSLHFLPRSSNEQ